MPALHFICRDVYLRVERSDTPFTRGYNAGQVIRVPVAHGDGNYIADDETIDAARRRGPRALPLCRADGALDPNWNLNGAIDAIAGILNERGNVLGMMPHPENLVEAAHGRHRRPRPVRGLRRRSTAQHEAPPPGPSYSARVGCLVP